MVPERRGLWLVYVIAPILAACSLLYELLIAQTLAVLAANTVVWYSLTVGAYLGAMGLGALVYGSRPERPAWQALHRVETLLSIVGGSAVVLIYLAHTLHLYFDMSDANGTAAALFFGTALFVVLLVGFLTGIELPVLIRLGNELSSKGPVTNRVLGLDYMGALFDGLAFPLLLLPRFELFTIGFATAIVNWSIAAFVLWDPAEGRRRSVRALAMNAAVGGLLVLALVRWADVQQFFLKRYYYYFEASDSVITLLSPMPNRPDVLRVNSPYQKIDIVHDDQRALEDDLLEAYSTKYRQDPSQPRDHFLFLNGDLQVSSNLEELYHEYFAHVPVVLNGSVPRRVLVLGAGDGLLVRELIKYTAVEEIVHVDLDGQLVELARTHPVLTGMNGNALEDRRVRTLIGDAYQYLRKSSEQFDAIYLDFPYPSDYNVSKLYSREFFHFVRERLSPGGYAVFTAVEVANFTDPAPNGTRTLDPSSEWLYHYNSLRKAGFETIVPYVSSLELGNSDALGVVERDLRETLDETEAPAPWRVQRELTEAVILLEQGFVSMWKDRRELMRDYWELPVRLHVLNEERFRLAFLPFPTPETVDPDRVNSIMRPTLPATPMWYIRTAW